MCPLTHFLLVIDINLTVSAFPFKMLKATREIVPCLTIWKMQKSTKPHLCLNLPVPRFHDRRMISFPKGEKMLRRAVRHKLFHLCQGTGRRGGDHKIK